ncbi:short-chain dehydrogenase [Burkholderia thailandensis]|nr:hypothetical protein [Burkholderia thailandensis]AVR24481.1 short-chain dehydrogenase [Burkholderia thailandensis]PJO72360.1 short-chain dehydrogenase [Burkholderia thailandensis]
MESFVDNEHSMTHKMHMHDFASVGGGVSARRIGAAKRRVDGRIDAAASIQREVAHADFGEGGFFRESGGTECACARGAGRT